MTGWNASIKQWFFEHASRQNIRRGFGRTLLRSSWARVSRAASGHPLYRRALLRGGCLTVAMASRSRSSTSSTSTVSPATIGGNYLGGAISHQSVCRSTSTRWGGVANLWTTRSAVHQRPRRYNIARASDGEPQRNNPALPDGDGQAIYALPTPMSAPINTGTHGVRYGAFSSWLTAVKADMSSNLGRAAVLDTRTLAMEAGQRDPLNIDERGGSAP